MPDEKDLYSPTVNLDDLTIYENPNPIIQNPIARDLAEVCDFSGPQELTPQEPKLEMPPEEFPPAVYKRAVVFQNPGLIDPVGITTFGINAKLDNTAIGYFGTGLKYAIAVLLRHRHTITIWRGTEKYTFSTQEHESRGKTFQLVLMNGHPMGFTTELGKNWKLWQAFRELWCNCKDEKGSVFDLDILDAKDPPYDKNTTSIIVEGAEFTNVYYNRHEYILEGTPFFVVPNKIEFYYGSRQTVFYRGIAVLNLPKEQKTLYTYNILSYMELTEDRTVKYDWYPGMHLAEVIQASEDRDLIEKIVSASRENTFEGNIRFDYCYSPVKEVFCDTVNNLVRLNGIRAVNQLAAAKAAKYKQPEAPRALELNTVQRGQIQQAVSFCHALGYEVKKYEIQWVTALNGGALGSAEKGRIKISKEAFDRGTKQLIITLIEEYMHLEFGVLDESRGFQEKLLHELVTLGEKFVKVAL